MSDDILALDLWMGGKAAANVRAHAKATKSTPEQVLIALAEGMAPIHLNGRQTQCASCGDPLVATRTPRLGEHFYCREAECRRQANNERQRKYRRMHTT